MKNWEAGVLSVQSTENSPTFKKEKNLFESVAVGGNQSFCKSSDKFNFKNSITVFQVFEEIQENKECVEIKRKKINVWRLNIITFDLYNKSPAEQLRAFVVGTFNQTLKV